MGDLRELQRISGRPDLDELGCVRAYAGAPDLGLLAAWNKKAGNLTPDTYRGLLQCVRTIAGLPDAGYSACLAAMV